MERVELETKRLILVPLGTQFLDSVCEYSLDHENNRYMLFMPDSDRQETLQFLRTVDRIWAEEKPSVYEFAVLLDGVQIGACSVTPESGAGELGWILNKRYWGHGYAAEAAEALVKWASEELGITRFIAHCDTRNVPSYKTMEKLGMVRTGEYGGRRNKLSAEESREYEYTLVLDEQTKGD